MKAENGRTATLDARLQGCALTQTVQARDDQRDKTQWEDTMIRKSPLTHFALIFFLAGIVGCSTPLTTREKGAGIGALGGAAAGGIIGSTVGSAGAGAAIGGLLGLGAGALIGDQLQGQDMKQDEQQQRIDQSQRELDRQRREIERLKQGEY